MDAFVQELRQRRAELRESMSALERALSAAATGEGGHWVERVHVALVELDGDFRTHIEITEGPAGLYEELSRTTPRLSGEVDRLAHDHAVVGEQLAKLLALTEPPGGADAEAVRDLGTDLLAHLLRHRQRGADLVFEAYEVDIGGET